MNLRFPSGLRALPARLRAAVATPAALALLPALVLVGFWLGGEDMLIMLALGFPVCLLFAGAHRTPAATGGEGRSSFGDAVDVALRRAAQTSRRTGCILLELDDFAMLRDRVGRDAMDVAMAQITQRLRAALRSQDTVCLIDDNLLAVCIAPVRQLDLDNLLQMGARLQTVLEKPVVIDATTIHVTGSVGVVLDRSAPRMTACGLIRAATAALAEARRHGPSAMRAFSPAIMKPAILPSASLVTSAVQALEDGQIRPWFQPQICTDTGRVSGFEALARWHHPDHGVIPPAEFLPLLVEASRMGRLGEVMLHHALAALKSWDAAGLDVPAVGVNFSPEELRNPTLAERIEWDLDLFDLPAHRLNVEILETVMATSSDETVVRNIAALSRLGCQIDLDDFGTGHASISSIRRFDVQRLKIDRSFVMRVDRDPDQQRMVSAILTMAEQLGLATLAEGVETAGEHAMLAQLGCGHVQGYGIARPMPLDQTAGWVAGHLSRLQDPPPITWKIG